jgi:hypothetical protein
MMGISVTKRDLEQLNFYIENYFIKSMNDAGVSFGGMAFALENLYDAIEEASRTMEEENED